MDWWRRVPSRGGKIVAVLLSEEGRMGGLEEGRMGSQCTCTWSDQNLQQWAYKCAGSLCGSYITRALGMWTITLREGWGIIWYHDVFPLPPPQVGTRWLLHIAFTLHGISTS